MLVSDDDNGEINITGSNHLHLPYPDTCADFCILHIQVNLGLLDLGFCNDWHASKACVWFIAGWLYRITYSGNTSSSLHSSSSATIESGTRDTATSVQQQIVMTWWLVLLACWISLMTVSL